MTLHPSNKVRNAINEKLDQAFVEVPEAIKDREALYDELLRYFNDYGFLPDFIFKGRLMSEHYLEDLVAEGMATEGRYREEAPFYWTTDQAGVYYVCNTRTGAVLSSLSKQFAERVVALLNVGKLYNADATCEECANRYRNPTFDRCPACGGTFIITIEEGGEIIDAQR